MDLKSSTDVIICRGWTAERILAGGTIVVDARKQADRSPAPVSLRLGMHSGGGAKL